MYTVIQTLVYLSCPTTWNLTIGLKIEDPPNVLVEFKLSITEMGSILKPIHLC